MHDLELAVIIHALKIWRKYLLSRRIILIEANRGARMNWDLRGDPPPARVGQENFRRKQNSTTQGVPLSSPTRVLILRNDA